MFAGQRPLWRFEKCEQQRIFAVAQCDLLPLRIEQPAVSPFQPPPVETVSAALGVTGARNAAKLLSSQDRPHARQQLAQAERLDQVIIRTELEADHAVYLVDAMACHDDNRHVRMRPEFSQQIESIVVAEPKVE